jgi:hypothetical protein
MSPQVISSFADHANIMQLKHIFFGSMAKITLLYKDAFDDNAHDLIVSSRRIFQETSLRTMLAASNSSSQKIEHNATTAQQKIIVRLLTTNQRALDIMRYTWVETMTLASSSTN